MRASIIILLLALPVLAQEPTAVDRALRAAEDQIAAGQSAQALAALGKLREKEKNDERIPFLMAQCEFNLWLASERKAEKHLEAARLHIVETFRLKSPYPECSFLSGWIEAQAGNFGGAVKGYKEALDGRFRVQITRQNLAFCLFKLGVTLETQLDDDPQITEEEIIEIFEEAKERFHQLALDTRFLPRDRAAFRAHWYSSWSNIAALHQKAKNYPAAEKLLRGLIAEQPGNPFHYHHLGLLFGDQRDWKKAVMWYEKALEVGAKMNFLEPHLRLAYIHSSTGEREKAEGHFAKFFEAFPDSWEGHYERGRHYRRVKEFDLAIADLLRCTDIDPEGYLAMKELSECYRQNGESEKAEEWAKKFKAKDKAATASQAPPQPEKEGAKKEAEKEDKGGE